MATSDVGSSHMISSHWPVNIATQVLVVLAFGLAYPSLTFFYNRYLHPLSKFPGPLAAVRSSRWLYQVSMTGHAEEAIEKVHAAYQTKVLRIAPNELHISDINCYDIIYGSSEVFPKYDRFYDMFEIPHSLGTENDIQRHEEHRRRLSPFYSRTALRGMENLFHEKAAVIMTKLKRVIVTNPSVDIVKVFKCHVLDVFITAGFGCPSNLTEEEEESFETRLAQAFDGLQGLFWGKFKKLQSPVLKKIMDSIPDPFHLFGQPADADFLVIIQAGQKYLKYYEEHGNQTSHPVMFDRIQSEPEDQKLSEAIETLFAGLDTVASSMTTGIINIILQPKIEEKLVKALDQVQAAEDGTFRLVELEKIEYLVACVKESTRIGMGISGRLPRVVPKNLSQPLVVDGMVIPPGTVVSMSAYTMNYNQELWGPDARVFNPDRWLQGDAVDLGKKNHSFSKGKRRCPAQNIAYAEMTLLMAYMFKNFKMSLPPGFEIPETLDWFATKYPPSGVAVQLQTI